MDGAGRGVKLQLQKPCVRAGPMAADTRLPASSNYIGDESEEFSLVLGNVALPIWACHRSEETNKEDVAGGKIGNVSW